MADHLVFARTSYEEPLEYQGAVDNADPAAALERYGDSWVELTLVPVNPARWVVGERPEA